MRVLYFFIILLVGELYLGCNSKTKVKVTDLTIVETDSAPEPPPPPPLSSISNNMTLEEWLIKLCDREKPNASIIAYNFGLFETENGYTVYLIGSKEYDQTDSDWATNNDFEPTNKYYPLPKDEYKKLKWEQVLEKIKFQLKAFTKTDKFKNSFFASAKAITTGFDDGDLVVIK